MDLVLVGLPGSGKSAVGRRIAQRHQATFVDLDELVESQTGRTVPEIFAAEGEAGFRRHEHEAVVSLGPADMDPELRLVISTGGGSVIVTNDSPTTPISINPTTITSSNVASMAGYIQM